MELKIPLLRKSWTSQICYRQYFESRWIWMVGYGENSNWCWHTVYPQGFSWRCFYTCRMTCISVNRPSINECPSWSDMVHIANYHTFNYGARTGFVKIYTFCINAHNWPYISCSTNQTLGKLGWRNNYATKNGNWNKTFSIKIHIWFCSCAVWKATAHVRTKALSMCHRSQTSFHGIFARIPQHQKGYLIYVPST